MNDDDGRARAHKLIQSKMHHMDMSQQHLEAKYEHIIGTINISSVNSSAAGCWSVGTQLDALLHWHVDLRWYAHWRIGFH